MVMHACSPSHWGGEGRRTVVKASLGKVRETLSEKQTKSIRTKGMAQVIE
jgi:hypothetical protein